MQGLEQLPRITLPRTPVNKGKILRAEAARAPGPLKTTLLRDLYAHEGHRTVEHVVERVGCFGSHHDIGSVGDRASRASRSTADLAVYPRYYRGARLYALQLMPVPVYDVVARHYVHCAPLSLEEAVELADGGVARPLYLHLVVAPWGRNKALADDVVGVIVHRRIGYLDAGF